MISGSCKLHWYQKFYNNIILFICTKTLDTFTEFWLVSSIHRFQLIIVIYIFLIDISKSNTYSYNLNILTYYVFYVNTLQKFLFLHDTNVFSKLISMLLIILTWYLWFYTVMSRPMLYQCKLSKHFFYIFYQNTGSWKNWEKHDIQNGKIHESIDYTKSKTIHAKVINFQVVAQCQHKIILKCLFSSMLYIRWWSYS